MKGVVTMKHVVNLSIIIVSLLLMLGGGIAYAEDIAPPGEVRLLTPDEMPTLPPADLPAHPNITLAASLPTAAPFPAQLPSCLEPTGASFAVLVSPVYPETGGRSFCVKVSTAPENYAAPEGCPYTEYAYYFEPCGSCGTGSQWVHTWRRIVDPCFGYIGPWVYLGKGCLPC